MKFHILLASVFCSAMAASAAAPAGYYDSCKGKCGAALLKQLESTISSHTNIGYAALWDLYKTSDVDANGKIWDMYSTKRWNPGKEQCGTYSSVGDCYNREHSLPKSWFNDAAPMVSDGFHIYPTDGKVNGQRSNYPFGECANGTTLAASGGVKPLGKLGKSTFSGYSGTVFEPDDEYKGDFARTYFYMAACYNSRISTWSSDMLAGNAYPVFTSWAKELLLKWHRQDPVSDKERKRNDAVYAAQHNRNPFIDNPDLAEHIWGTMSTQGWGSGTVVATPELTMPANGSTLDLGTIASGTTGKATVTLRGNNLSEAVSVSVSGAGFAATPTSVDAAMANAGAVITISYTGAAAGNHTATIAFKSGAATTAITVKVTVTETLTALPPAEISPEGFTARWTVPATATGKGKLYVATGGRTISGYPVEVDMATGEYAVSNLEAETTYEYYLTCGSSTSNTITVTTPGEHPELYLEPGNDLAFTAAPGVPSAPLTVFIEAYNVAGDIRISVHEPFEVSLDKQFWGRSLTLSEDDGQFFIRLNGSTPGTYHTSIAASAENCFNDALMAEGVIGQNEPLLESFEGVANFGYNGTGRQEDIAVWDFTNAGVFDDARDVHSGRQGARFNKQAGGTVAMVNPLGGGVSEVAFFTRLWDDEPATVELQYSLDNGGNWTTATTAYPAAQWKQTVARLNLEGGVSLRFVKTAGGRVALDDVTIAPMTSDLSSVQFTPSWDAFASAGRIAVNNPLDKALPIAVYAIDGSLIWRAEAPVGTIFIPVPTGHYIIASGPASRRVTVR